MYSKLRNKIKQAWLEFCLYCRVVGNALNPTIGDVTPVGRLYVQKISANGEVTDYGLVSTKVVTDAGVAYLVGCLNSAQASDVFKYHGAGTGTTAEAVGQTALITEVGSRATGSQTTGSGANVYRTVGTITFGSTLAITEHGIFSAASAGTMLDRSVFAAINVINGDSIQFTYDLTLPSGS